MSQVPTDTGIVQWERRPTSGRPGPATPVSRSAFGHGGITGTQLWVDPGHDLVLVYLTGVWEGPSEPADAVENAIYAALES